MTIYKRLIYGYGLILGIALAGTTAGLGIGNHYQRNAFVFQRAATDERQLLNDLQVQILYNRPGQQLLPHLDTKVDFLVETQKLLGRLTSIQIVLDQHQELHDEMDRLVAHHDHDEHSAIDEPLEAHPYDQFSMYEITVQQFHQRTQLFMESVEALYDDSGQISDITAAQQHLLDLDSERSKVGENRNNQNWERNIGRSAVSPVKASNPAFTAVKDRGGRRRFP
ncbi:MAG: hypothetical protein F6K30_27555 [Cyanothece sp. SIO2G6]|nr:hypothetical protein [Cyanothece sp. SIO2G6]